MAVLFAGTLVACESGDGANYNEFIHSGLDYLALEDYTRAEIQFEQALSLKEDDVYTSSLVAQSLHFNQAHKFIEEEKVEEAIAEAERVIELKDGSQGLIVKAEQFIVNLTGEQVESETDTDENEKHNETDSSLKVKDSQDKSESGTIGNDVITDSPTSIDIENMNGFYAAFEGTEFESDLLLALMIKGDVLVEVIPSWNERITYDITSMTLDDNSLVIYYEPNGEDMHEIGPGTLTATISSENSNVQTIIVDGEIYYAMTDEQIADYELNIPEWE